jgi:hypothetical protein
MCGKLVYIVFDGVLMLGSHCFRGRPYLISEIGLQVWSLVGRNVSVVEESCGHRTGGVDRLAGGVIDEVFHTI